MRRCRQWIGESDLVAVTDATGDTRTSRVQAWACRRALYETGDAVPHLRNRSTYSVQTEHGWYANVAQGRLVSWSEKPIMDSTFDSRGRLIGGTPR